MATWEELIEQLKTAVGNNPETIQQLIAGLTTNTEPAEDATGDMPEEPAGGSRIAGGTRWHGSTYPYVRSQEREQDLYEYDGPDKRWAAAFASQHGGEGPTWEDYYDKLWSEQFARINGRPPEMNDWRVHYYVKYMGNEPEQAEARVRYETGNQGFNRATDYSYKDTFGPDSIKVGSTGGATTPKATTPTKAATTGTSTGGAGGAGTPSSPSGASYPNRKLEDALYNIPMYPPTSPAARPQYYVDTFRDQWNKAADAPASLLRRANAQAEREVEEYLRNLPMSPDVQNMLTEMRQMSGQDYLDRLGQFVPLGIGQPVPEFNFTDAGPGINRVQIGGTARTPESWELVGDLLGQYAGGMPEFGFADAGPGPNRYTIGGTAQAPESLDVLADALVQAPFMDYLADLMPQVRQRRYYAGGR